MVAEEYRELHNGLANVKELAQTARKQLEAATGAEEPALKARREEAHVTLEKRKRGLERLRGRGEV